MKDQNKYLIIGGSTKCGTTSVFNYFEFHPGICPCIMKESRYFLETDYQLIAKQRANEKYSHFSDLFRNCKPGALMLEATPDYLYSTLAAEKIKAEIPNCKIIFILREPVSRLESWFRFASLNGLIAAGTSYKDYILQQQSNSNDAPQHMRSLEQGRYASYVEYYIKTFGKENIHICFYEHLINDPEKFCRDICLFTDIDQKYFENYTFKIYNKSVAVKNVNAHRLFRKIKRTIRPATKLLPESLRKKLKLAGYNLEQSYTGLNASENGPGVDLTSEMNNFLRQYYDSSNKQLAEISGRQLPW